MSDKLWKKIPVLSWIGENVGLILVILKHKFGSDMLPMDERADPDSAEWKNNPWHDVFIQRRDTAVIHSEGKIALDLCCGIGWTSSAMAEVATKVTAVDYSTDALELAREKYGKPNLEFIQMDATILSFESESFDTVVSMEAIEYFTFENGRKLIQEAFRVLKKGGTFVGSTPAVENRNPLKIYSLQLQDPFHLFLYSKSILEKSLLEFFPEVEVVSQERDWLLFTCKK